MKYNTINIHIRDNKWLWHLEIRPEEREETETVPNANGWYHFPSTMLPSEAFKKLRACMVKRHKFEIKRLEKSLTELQKLKSTLQEAS